MIDSQSQHASLEGRSSEILHYVSKSATEEQWAEWLRVPLEHAAADGNLDLFEALLGAGTQARVGWKGCGGRTLLDAAVRGGSVDIVSSLLTTGSQQDVNVVTYPPGRSNLLTAILEGHEAVARRLVLAGADVNFVEADNTTVLHEAVERGYGELVNDLLLAGANATSVRAKILQGETALHIAASEGHADIVSALLLRGAERDQPDEMDNTALTYATRFGHVPVVEVLLAAGADFHTLANLEGVAATSVLNLAAELGRDGVLKAFIHSRAGVDGGVAGCMAALPWAIFGDQPDTIDVLVEAGADVEMVVTDGMTPLLYAAAGCHFDAMRALLRYGASVTARNQTGSTALHFVCSHKRWGCATVVDELLRRGADETARDNDGCVPATMLGPPAPASADPQCPRVEVARIWMLLAQAPADRAWRRRGWLAILRSRAENAKSSEVGCGEDGPGSRTHREKELPRKQRSGRDEKGPGGEEDAQEYTRMIQGGLTTAVNMLTERASKDVFCNTVGFL